MHPPVALILFRVSSPLCSTLVVPVWAQDAVEACLSAREFTPALARLEGVTAVPA